MSKLKLRSALRKVVASAVPKNIRHEIYRNMIRLNLNPDPRLKIKLARSQTELEAAFKLLHDRYVKAGFMNPHPSGLRVTKYHALPSTSTIVAMLEQEVVGTISLIRRSAFGLPMETLFDLSPIAASGARIVELSALCVHPKYSGRGGEILFPLLKFLYEYAVGYFGADVFVIAVNPAHFDFYEALLLFHAIGDRKGIAYSFVNNLPAVGAELDLHWAREAYRSFYAHRRPEKNLFAYFDRSRFAGFEFPQRKLPAISDPVMTPELLNYFFAERTNVFSEISEREKHILDQLYRDHRFQAVIPRAQTPPVWSMREAVRFDVRCEGRIHVGANRRLPVDITSASAGGLGAYLKQPLELGQLYRIDVDLGSNRHSPLTARACWNSSSNYHGFKIVESNPRWGEFLTWLEGNLLRNSS